jgi:urea carboxylase-associated protein 2
MTDDTPTSTLEQARAHARAQARSVTGTGPTIPASSATDLPEGVASADVLWDETIAPGGYAARVLPRDSVLRITDIEGDACVQLLAYAAANPAERLNVADTVKVQWQAYLGAGSLLLSDMGRVLLTIVEDTSARHDCLCGGSNRATNQARYGDGSVWGGAPNARDLLALGAAKHGLGRVDLPPSMNLFKGSPIAPDGSIGFDGDARPGAYVQLRAEVAALVLLAVTPHPLDDRPEYTVTRVRGTAWRAERPADDPLRRSSPERERAFQNTDEVVR